MPSPRVIDERVCQRIHAGFVREGEDELSHDNTVEQTTFDAPVADLLTSQGSRTIRHFGPLMYVLRPVRVDTPSLSVRGPPSSDIYEQSGKAVAPLRITRAMTTELTATDRTVLQTADEVETNPLGVDDDVAAELVPTLNDSLATLQVLARQVQKHHWTVEGPEFFGIHAFLGDAYEELEEAIDELAERVTALGGVPVAGPEAAVERSLVDFEGETVYDVRSSLAVDLDGYETLATTLREDAILAQRLGDLGTADLLQEILSEVEEDAHHVEHLLADDTLQRRD